VQPVLAIASSLLIYAPRSLFSRLGLVTWRWPYSIKSAKRWKAPMSSTLSSARSWFSADPTKSSVDATLVPADPNVPTDPKNDRFPIKWPLFDRRISRAIAFLIMFCFGVAAFLAWQSSRETASAPQTARVAPSPNLGQQLEAMSHGLTALRQSVDQLAASLGQMRNDITNLQTDCPASHL
jgi:hypothetical protein